MSKKSDFGLIGLAVMGQNLVLNVESRGFQVSVYNRTTSVTDEFLAKHPGKNLVGSKSLEEFVQSLDTPRKIHIMVKSTAVKDSERDAVDAVIEQLIPLLDQGDIVIAHFLNLRDLQQCRLWADDNWQFGCSGSH